MWHFSSCDYSVSRTGLGTFPHLKWTFWNKSGRFLVFYLLLSQRYLSSMWQGSWIRLRLSRVPWCMTKKLPNTQACSAYIYLKSFWEGEVEKHMWLDLFCESCRITDQSLLKVKFNADALLGVWRKCWLHH